MPVKVYQTLDTPSATPAGTSTDDLHIREESPASSDVDSGCEPDQPENPLFTGPLSRYADMSTDELTSEAKKVGLSVLMSALRFHHFSIANILGFPLVVGKTQLFPESTLPSPNPKATHPPPSPADVALYTRVCSSTYGPVILETLHHTKPIPGPVRTLRALNVLRRYSSTSQRYDAMYLDSFGTYLGIPRSDIIKYTSYARPFQPVYFVALDRSRQAILVTVRGTVSIADIITDMMAEPIEYRGGWTHSGFAVACQWLWKEIIDTVDNLVAKYPEYTLEFIGHSMGGACCALLADSYRITRPQHADSVFHYAIGCPPTISDDLLPEFREFCTTVVHRGDYAPRLSMANVQRFSCAIQALNRPSKRHSLISGRVVSPTSLSVPGNISQALPGWRVLGMTVQKPRLYPLLHTDLHWVHFYQPFMHIDHMPHRYEKAVRRWGRHGGKGKREADVTQEQRV